MKVATITMAFNLNEEIVCPVNTESAVEILITEGDTEEDIHTGFEYSHRRRWQDDKFLYISFDEEIIHAVDYYRELAGLNDHGVNNNYGKKSYRIKACPYIKKLHEKLPEKMYGVTSGGSMNRLKRYHSQYVSGMAVSLLAYNDDHAALKSEKIYGVPPSLLYNDKMELCSGYY